MHDQTQSLTGLVELTNFDKNKSSASTSLALLMLLSRLSLSALRDATSSSGVARPLRALELDANSSGPDARRTTRCTISNAQQATTTTTTTSNPSQYKWLCSLHSRFRLDMRNISRWSKDCLIMTAPEFGMHHVMLIADGLQTTPLAYCL